MLAIATFLVATANVSWWQAVADGRSWRDAGSWGVAGACFITLVGIHFALLGVLANRWIIKPLLTALVILSTGAAYYMRAYALVMDPSMIQNVLHTDVNEAREFLDWRMFMAVSLWSAPPVAFIWWVRIVRMPWLKATIFRVASVTGALVLSLLATLAVSRDLTSFMRNNREARYLITPANIFYGLATSSVARAKDMNVVREKIGLDAAVIRVARAARRRVLVLVIGETARAANFSLLGYTRETNPELARLGVVSFSDVTSCGTSTEISVPCMFSRQGRAEYDQRRIRNSEGLLDVLARAGYRVKWIDNQSGCKGVCKGVEYSKVDPARYPDLCDEGECLDGVLVRQAEEELQAVEQDTVLVLHMLGNHGPAYFRRYPPEFRRFIPDCATAQLRNCTRSQVVNSYDNAILYTDHVLAGVIQALSRRGARLDAAMIYVSDHGESLGENGLYLHGIPNAIAPTQQTHVPMVMWLSPNLTKSADASARCLQGRAANAWSHDNLFHSVLGLMNVRTTVYRADRDIFDGCRGGTFAVHRRLAGDTAQASPN